MKPTFDSMEDRFTPTAVVPPATMSAEIVVFKDPEWIGADNGGDWNSDWIGADDGGDWSVPGEFDDQGRFIPLIIK